MVDTSKCFSLVRGRAMRVTRLDGCGAVVLGPGLAGRLRRLHLGRR